MMKKKPEKFKKAEKFTCQHCSESWPIEYASIDKVLDHIETHKKQNSIMKKLVRKSLEVAVQNKEKFKVALK